MADLVELRPSNNAAPAKPSGLPDIPGDWTEGTWSIAGREFRLTLPADPDAFLDDAEVHAAHERTEYMPYWAYLWPSALHMAKRVRQADWSASSEILELAAGIGLVGLAALSKGHAVTFSDYEP